MSLESAGSSIGPNNFEMLPFGDQEFSDFCTGEILISAERARTDFQSTYATGSSVQDLGPAVQLEVQQSLPQSQTNVASQYGNTQELLDLPASPVISDAAIAAAPFAPPLGSKQALSPFTKGQTQGGNRKDWAATLILQSRPRDVPVAVSSQARPNAGRFPAPPWGSPAGGNVSAGGGRSPLGKLLLLGGLALIGASLFDRS